MSKDCFYLITKTTNRKLYASILPASFVSMLHQLRKLLPAVLVAVMAIGVGIWTAGLPTIVDALLRIDAPDHPGLARLRIGHLMAGGGTTGTEFLAGALKQTALAKLFGYVRTTRSRRAWRKFAKTLEDAERCYLSPAWGFGLDSPADPRFAADEIAEGLLYVAHTTKLAMEVYLQEQPRMVRLVSPTQKLIGDNPNAQYYISSLHVDDDGNDNGNGDQSPSHEFVVKGCRTPNEVYLSYAVHAPIPGKAFEKVVTDKNDLGMEFDEHGCYVLYLSPAFPGQEFLTELGNRESMAVAATWLETPPDALSLVSRHYFRSEPGRPPGAISETVRVSIERYSKDTTTTAAARPPSLPISDEAMAKRIARADDFLQRHTLLMPQPDPTTSPPFFSLVPNVMGRPQKWKHQAEGMGAVDIAYSAGRFLLKPGEALLLEGSVPACRFANVVVWNRFLQTLDYTRPEYPVSAILDTPEDDAPLAPFRIVLSRERPEGFTGTWIYTEGRPSGTVFFRFLLPEDEDEDGYPKISAKVVRVDDLVVA